jgi:hypothetical protein
MLIKAGKRLEKLAIITKVLAERRGFEPLIELLDPITV